MKNMNFKLIAVMLITAGLFAGCGLNKMVKNYDEGVRYTPETNPLENHGGRVAANVAGSIDEGYFHQKAVVEITPVLKYAGGEQELETVILRGSKTTTTGTMVNSDQNSRFSMNNVIAFEPDMLASELYIRAKLYKEGNADRATILPERKVADGVINTSQRIKNDHHTSIAPHEYEEEVIITKTANIYFAYMRHNLNWRLDLNRQAEAQAKINEITEFIERGWELKSVDVDAWASPEGEIAFNVELSENRSETGQRYVMNLFDEKDIELPELNVGARGEDFDGFMAALNSSNLPDKQTIANVINSQIEPAERERRIKDMTLIYGEIEKILEPLRRAEISVHAYEPKKSHEEIADLAINNPGELDEKELLFAATLTDDMQTKLAIYRSALQLFPRSYKGFNNAAAILLDMGEIDEAAGFLERANQIAPGNGHVQNNLGVVAAWQKDYESALSLFRSAKAQGIPADYNIGTIQIINGEYQAALSSFSGHTCLANVALAQLMTGNQSAAMNTLNCAPQCGHAAYLKAVIAARNNDTQAMYNNLRAAIEFHEGLKNVAADDREFVQFFGQAEFQNIVR
jgi:tetratricopeptide (TPR) repeat protein